MIEFKWNVYSVAIKTVESSSNMNIWHTDVVKGNKKQQSARCLCQNDDDLKKEQNQEDRNDAKQFSNECTRKVNTLTATQNEWYIT